MKRFLAISLIVLGLSVALKAQEHTPRPAATPNKPATPSSTPSPLPAMDASGWIRFSNDLGRFSVMVPTAPIEKSETKDSEHGPFTTHLFIVKGSPVSPVYLIGWVDYDPGFNFNRQAELDANRDNFVKGLQATLLTTRTTVINGYSAIEFTAETTDKIFKSRVLLVGRRPYQLVIGTPKGQDDTANVTRFFNSFKVSAN
ncbi:MAG TPA: hypothetical protein VJR02_15040 [Pyrinomonadaceae bacterium]|nr:hypothetical protein [Pyrinomonadaceae bacterium]